MKRLEIENLNNLLRDEIKIYAHTSMNNVLERIKTYRNVYETLRIVEEYHRTINLAYIPWLDIDFYKMEKLISIIQVIEVHKVKIYGNVLTDGLDSFISYLIELVYELNIDIEDKNKIEKELNKI